MSLEQYTVMRRRAERAQAEVARLRAALLKVYECEGCRHCSDLAGTVLDTTSASTDKA